LDSPEYAHKFAEAIHELTRKHNSDRNQPVGKRVFRIGVATGDIALEPLKGGVILPNPFSCCFDCFRRINPNFSKVLLVLGSKLW
jgi:hypothetical protein